MKPIGIVYRHGYNDYEIQLMDFNKNDTETLLTIPMKYGDESSGLRGDRDLSLADANVDYWEKDWGTEELAREIFDKVYDPWTEDERVCIPKIEKDLKDNPLGLIRGLLMTIEALQ